MASKRNELPRPRENRSLFLRAGHGDPTTTSKLEQPFVAQEPQGTEDGVPVHAEHRRQIARRRQALAWAGFSVTDCSPKLGGHLLVQFERFAAIDLDLKHGAIHNSFI